MTKTEKRILLYLQEELDDAMQTENPTLDNIAMRAELSTIVSTVQVIIKEGEEESGTAKRSTE